MSSFSAWRPHPWHGLSVGNEPPRRLNAYIELTPHDLVRYELDEDSGYLRLARPQRTAVQPPSLYGFVPRTCAGRHVAALMPGAERGDGEALDVCVLSERPVTRADILVEARLVGGLPIRTEGVADDKLIAVLESDGVWGGIGDIGGVPRALLDRIVHYFATCDLLPDSPRTSTLGEPYDLLHAEAVLLASMQDYEERFGALRRAAQAGRRA